MAIYMPDFTNAKVQKRMARVFTYCCIQLPVNITDGRYGVVIGTDKMKEVFGHHSKPLSKYLKHFMLTKTSFYCNRFQGIAYEYMFNVEGFKRLCEIANIPTCRYYHMYNNAVKTYGAELTKGNITHSYSDKFCARESHPIQSMSNDVRPQFLANFGYNHNCDIDACAPTSLIQYARRNPLFIKPTLTIDNIIANKVAVRNQIAKATGCSINQVKVAITAMFTGAPCSEESGYNDKVPALCKIIPQTDRRKLFYTHPIILALKDDLPKMWAAIKEYRIVKYGSLGKLTAKDKTHCVSDFAPLLIPAIKAHRKAKRNKLIRDPRFNGSIKAGIYFELEYQMLTAVKQLFKRSKLFTEHDGWRSKIKIEPVLIEQHIREQTRFNVTIKYEYVPKDNGTSHLQLFDDPGYDYEYEVMTKLFKNIKI